jgi:hypothetical protein
MVQGHTGAAACGVTGSDGAEEAPVPAALAADTVNVYDVPLTSPVTAAEVAGGEPAMTVAVCELAPTWGVMV